MKTEIIKNSLKCGCPKCGTPRIFPNIFTLEVKDKCDACGLDLKDHDSGDGPAFFALTILCFVLTPLALWLAFIIEIPLWAHAVIWTFVSIAICIATMQPLKAYFIALNYKYREGKKGV
jgi:uncharacterized protein (DUF983 family)